MKLLYWKFNFFPRIPTCTLNQYYFSGVHNYPRFSSSCHGNSDYLIYTCSKDSVSYQTSQFTLALFYFLPVQADFWNFSVSSIK